MVGSAAIKQGRSANRKQSIFFWPYKYFANILQIVSKFCRSLKNLLKYVL